MSATAEKTLSKKCVEKKPHGWFHERIENSSGNGTADLVLSYCSIDVWIELKCAALPKNKDTVINCSHIRKGQIQWHRKKRRAQCQTWCLIQLGKGATARYCLFNSQWLQHLQDGQNSTWYDMHASLISKNLRAVLKYACETTAINSRRRAKGLHFIG